MRFWTGESQTSIPPTNIAPNTTVQATAEPRCIISAPLGLPLGDENGRLLAERLGVCVVLDGRGLDDCEADSKGSADAEEDAAGAACNDCELCTVTSVVVCPTTTYVCRTVVVTVVTVGLL